MYNELETTELRLGKIKKERVAVIKFDRVNERGPSSGKIECFLSFEGRE